MKLKLIFQILLFLPISLFMNFYYLPLRQAIRIPILTYKPKLLKIGGVVRIYGIVRFGMIRLGFPTVSIYPNSGITWENRGEIIFHDKCRIGNSSFISTGKNGKLQFGRNFSATAALKIACYNSITFDDNVLIGWGNTFVDTDFHSITFENGMKSKGYAPIIIGKNVWYAMGATTLKGVYIPDNCVIGAKSVVIRGFLENVEEKSLVAGNPAKIVRIGIFRDPSNDIINY